MFQSLYAGVPASTDRLIEVVDQHDRPFLLMPRRAALDRNMPRRVVLVSLRERGGRLWLAKNPRQKLADAHYLDFSARSHVLAGEARESAAARALEEALGLTGGQFVQRVALPPLVCEGAQRCALFTAVLRRGHVFSRDAGMFVDEDELSGLGEHFSELLHPSLLWCVQNGYLRENIRRPRST